jgi:hypothetical protein
VVGTVVMPYKKTATRPRETVVEALVMY